jgi:hypothetical protein
MSWIMITFAVMALGTGIWVGLGAPGWPHKQPPSGSRRRLETRPINPIQWGRSGSTRRTRRRR